ncbi:RHS repeat protein [Bradyrhizobium sp. WSM 1704]|uniref:RHS repeat protein n=1 Tax=Bradyrhizobium semiaridum TaxID=2821404 RepID=UPI001CE35AD1|nr:RHS repeat protein [Bradyrhizobium semiaridum]MCA6125519.1 RHS repeat protein [Bradyrhizobium semiaridum]
MSTSDQTVLSASGFINSIGVNTHAGFAWGGYNNLAMMTDDLKYLGVTHLRDAMATSPAAAPVVEGLAEAGYTFDFIVSSALPSSGSAGLQKYLASLEKFLAENPGSITAIEGLNEANHQPFSYNGSSSLSAAAQFQSALYAAVKADSSLASIPVYNLSLAYNDPQGYKQLGDMSGSTDYTNAHAYVSTGTNPEDSLAATLAAVKSAAAGKPVVITETGYTTQENTTYLGVDQTVQAKSILNTLVDAYKAGVSSTYLYELFDRNSAASDTNPENNYGLFNSDGTPKLAATAIHNLTTILADDGTGGHQPTDPLNYSLTGMPSTGNSMVLGKSNGTYDLVVWAEPRLWNDATDTEISNPTQTVTVNLGGVHHSVNVYDTMGGTTPIATYTDVSTLTIPVSDHPIIIEIDAPDTTPTSPPNPTAVSGTAAEIVPQLSELNDASALQSITLTDTHVLPVASTSTMNYIISHYGKALAAIQGGYSFSVTNESTNWTQTRSYDSTGKLTSTSNTGLDSHGQPMTTNITYTDGSSDAISYTNGVKSSFIHVATDGTRTTDSYNTAGVVTKEVVQKPNGYYSTTLYSNGVKTQAYVKNADGSQDNTTYNVTGQSYTTQVQHVDATGKITSVTRTHADGSLDSTQVYNSDGSSVITTYNAAGVKQVETDYHADKSKDVWTYNITGQNYTTEHDIYDSTGFLTTIARRHADGSLAFKLVQTKDGTKTSDWYDAKGVITSEVVQMANGYNSTTTYSNGVKTAAYIHNADGSQDNWSYNVTGQSYTTQHQHIDPSGKVTAVTRTHADGSLDSTQVYNSDGSSAVAYYNASGVKMSETDRHADGSRDVWTYNITGQTYTTEHDIYDASGFLTTLVRRHADGSLAFKLIQTKDGSKTTDWYDASGNLTSEVVQMADGHNSTTTYSNGVKTAAYIHNADGSQDNWSYNITGQSYTTQHQHIDASGKVTALTRTHADGSLDYTQVINPDGSSTIATYNASGVKMTQTDYHADKSKDVYTYNITGQNYTTEHDTYDATGFLTTLVRSHADGSLAFKLVQTSDGNKTTDWYDATGNLTSETVQKSNGYTSTTQYSGGEIMNVYVTNADMSQDNYSYHITGQTYTSQHQHIDPTGKVTEVDRHHADGSLDYTQVVNPDGSSVVTNYNAAGVKTTETDYHADGSRDVYLSNIAGQTYANEHDSYDTTGFLTSIVRTHADDSLAFKLVQTPDGTKTTDWYDTSGVITSEVVQKADGYNSTTSYTNGIATAAYIHNADGSQDNYRYNITGQTYTTQHQHLDAAGNLTEIDRTHADGTLDYQQVINSDGSKLTDYYDSVGNKTQEVANNADGTRDVFLFNFNGQQGLTQHENYNSSNQLQFFDDYNTSGVHNVTAVASGVTLQGGSGNDVFSATPASTTVLFDRGHDQVFNFQAGDASTHDIIEISKALVTDYSHLQITQAGTDAMVTISADDSILLKNINVASLTSHDFLFV